MIKYTKTFQNKLGEHAPRKGLSIFPLFQPEHNFYVDIWIQKQGRMRLVGSNFDLNRANSESSRILVWPARLHHWPLRASLRTNQSQPSPTRSDAADNYLLRARVKNGRLPLVHYQRFWRFRRIWNKIWHVLYMAGAFNTTNSGSKLQVTLLLSMK